MEKEFIIVDPYENDLHTYLWTPNVVKPKGVVQIIHGASEHVGRYREFATYLNTLGLIVIGNDHLGHGKTADTNEYVYFADDIGFHKVYEGIKTVRDYIEEFYPTLPVIMFAHSMGSFIGRYAILYDHKRYDQAIFSGTGWFNPLKIYLSIGLAKLIIRSKGKRHVSEFYNTKVADRAVKSMQKNGIINNRVEWITSDRNIQKEFLADEMCGKPFTIGAHLDMLRFLLEIQDKQRIKASASSTAIYFISGELDALGNYGNDIKNLYQYYKDCGYSNVKYTIFGNARHEVINEIDRDFTHQQLGKWILKYL